MNRDDIIRMAQEAGYLEDMFGLGIWDSEEFNSFATLVAAASASEEREACVKVCEELLSAVSTGDEHMDGVWDCIAAIRARGQS